MGKKQDDYGQLLEQYLADIKTNELMEKEMKRVQAIERTFATSKLDFVFPWHLQLGRYDLKSSAPGEEVIYTPFRHFNRRRNFLVWLHNSKVERLFTPAEIKARNQAEQIVFKSSLAFKGLGLFFLLNMRLFRRPLGRSAFFDVLLLYLGSYCILGSNIPGVMATWDLYAPLVQKMLESEKMKKRGLKNQFELLNQVALSDFKAVYYAVDIEFARYY